MTRSITHAEAPAVTPQEHVQQRDWVRASLLVDYARHTHHDVYVARRPKAWTPPGVVFAAVAANAALSPLQDGRLP